MMSAAPTRGGALEHPAGSCWRRTGEIARKRVTLVYRVLDPGVAARIVEADKRNADFRANSATRPSERALREQHAALATAQEEARGAGLVDFGMIVTATVEAARPQELARRRRRLRTSPRPRGSTLRRVYGSQDSAFAAGLPFGLVLGRHLKVPSEIRSSAMSPRATRPARAARAAARRGLCARGVAGGAGMGREGWRRLGAGAGTALSGGARAVQVCGLWPFATGTGTPMIGVPLGRNLLSGATLCADPISWFQDAHLISNPSVFVLGRPGLGKSSLLRRMALGLAAFGVMPIVTGDLKPDYVDLVAALGGQVIRLGRGRGYLNVLDPGRHVARRDGCRARPAARCSRTRSRVGTR